MFKQLLKLDGVREINRAQQQLIKGALSLGCPEGTYASQWNGYQICCLTPISGSPCGRQDCLIHVDACP